MTARQLTLDAYAARIAREDGIGRADAHANPEWRDVALDAVRRAALRNLEFTTDAILPFLNETSVTTHEPRALGPVMLAAMRQGWIEPTDRVERSTSVSRHCAKKQVWRSRLYKEV